MDQNNPMDSSSQPTVSPEPPKVESKDATDNKVLAIVGYLGILCILPLLLAKDSAFAKFHGKQGLVLLITWVILSVVSIVPILGWIIAFFGYIVGLVLMIVGMISAAKGEMKELPWIGQYASKINL